MVPLCPVLHVLMQILKAFTPALTLLLAVLTGLEAPRWPLAMSVLLIASGTTGAVLIGTMLPACSKLLAVALSGRSGCRVRCMACPYAFQNSPHL